MRGRARLPAAQAGRHTVAAQASAGHGGPPQEGECAVSGRHRLPRALFCQAPFNDPGAPGRPFGGRWDAGRRDVLAVLSAAAVQVPRPRVRGRRAVVVPGRGKGHARLDNSAGPFS